MLNRIGKILRNSPIMRDFKFSSSERIVEEVKTLQEYANSRIINKKSNKIHINNIKTFNIELYRNCEP